MCPAAFPPRPVLCYKKRERQRKGSFWFVSAAAAAAASERVNVLCEVGLVVSRSRR